MAKRPRYIHAVLLALVRDGYGVELTATYWSSKLLRTCDGNDQTLGQVEHGQGAFQFQPVRSDVRRRVAITATTTNALLSEAATVAVFEMATEVYGRLVGSAVSPLGGPRSSRFP